MGSETQIQNPQIRALESMCVSVVDQVEKLNEVYTKGGYGSAYVVAVYGDGSVDCEDIRQGRYYALGEPQYIIYEYGIPVYFSDNKTRQVLNSHAVYVFDRKLELAAVYFVVGKDVGTKIYKELPERVQSIVGDIIEKGGVWYSNTCHKLILAKRYGP
ncbi:MAG: hypothetical protein ABWK05_07180 [Pyrobaculum sp.]